MTEVRGPGIYEKIKVVYSFPSPGVNGAMEDAMAMVRNERQRRGLENGHDDDYYVEAYDDEVRVWFEYEKPSQVASTKSPIAGAHYVVVPEVGHKGPGESDSDRYEHIANRIENRTDLGGSNDRTALVSLLRNVVLAMRNQ